MDPGLAEEDRVPDFERNVDGAFNAHNDDMHKIASNGAASKNRGRFENVQYRRSPTFLANNLVAERA